MKTIPLTKGFIALVDDEDFEYLNQFKWQAQPSHPGARKAYACRTLYWKEGVRQYRSKRVFMHNEILGFAPVKGTTVDHRDRNSCNNQKGNLRIASSSQQIQNVGKRKGLYSSRFVGVSRHRGTGKWQSRIHTDRDYSLGLFDSEEQAAAAYNKAAKTYFGEFATINSV